MRNLFLVFFLTFKMASGASASSSAAEVFYQEGLEESGQISYATVTVDGPIFEYDSIVDCAPSDKVFFYLKNTTEESHVFSDILFDFGAGGNQTSLVAAIFKGPIEVEPGKIVVFFDSRQTGADLYKNIHFVKLDGREILIREPSVPSRFYVNNITLEDENDQEGSVTYKATPHGRTPVAYINVGSLVAQGPE